MQRQHTLKFFYLLFMLMYSTLIMAHPMPESKVFIDILDQQIKLELQLPIDRLEVGMNQTLPVTSLTSSTITQQQINAYMQSHTRVLTPTGLQWTCLLNKQSFDTTKPDELTIQFTCTPPAGASNRIFTLNYEVIGREIATHTALIFLRHDWANGLIGSDQRPQLVGTIYNETHNVLVDQRGGSWQHGFSSIFKLGMTHIAEGIDHLLFLLTLLLPASLLIQAQRWAGYAGLKVSIQHILKIATAFTIGHSLTLLAGALNWIVLPSKWIESLIAVSIMISAIHAIRPVFAGKEVLIALGFGLIHGLAFSTTLTELALSHWQLAISVLGFNLGIEAMQILLIAILMPWFLLLSQTTIYPYVKNSLAGFALLAAGTWFLERSLGLHNPINPLIEQLQQHPWTLLITLIITTTLARVLVRIKATD